MREEERKSKGRIDSPQRRKKWKCESVQRVRDQRHDPPCWSCTLESQYSGSKRKRLPTHCASCVFHANPASGFILKRISVCMRHLRPKVQTGQKYYHSLFSLHGAMSAFYSSTFSYLISSTCGGQVGQTAAGHRSKSFPASLPLLFPFSPSLTEPRKGQTRGHGGDRTWRRNSSGPVHQFTTWPPGRKQLHMFSVQKLHVLSKFI